MGNEFIQYCDCKAIKEAFNPDLEDVKYIININFLNIEFSKKSK